jgi:hypothetical protein
MFENMAYQVLCLWAGPFDFFAPGCLADEPPGVFPPLDIRGLAATCGLDRISLWAIFVPAELDAAIAPGQCRIRGTVPS